MSLDNYLAKAQTQTAEIRLAFDVAPSQVEQLYTRLQEIGFAQYVGFVLEHLADIHKYISLSDSQRKQKKWVNYPDGVLLRFAALQISVATVKLQNNIAGIAYLVNGGSYRNFHSEMAGGVCGILAQPPLRYWPFDQHKSPLGF